MQVSLIPGRSLDATLVSRWRELQSANPELASPFFAPEFTQAVAAARDDVEVAVIEDGGKPVAFFPFQREGGSVGKPVGEVLSDYHGLICAPGFECDPRGLVRKCGLIAWDFDHLLGSQTCFSPFHQHLEPSPQMDLSRGYEAYAAERRAAGSEQIKKCGNLMRRIEKEIGPLRFIAHSTDPVLLQQTLAWKTRQYLEGGKRDLFALGWTRAVVERIHATQTDNLAGMLSLLYAGDRLVAGHFGMRSRAVWHYWFPAYDAALAKYSPGLILLLKMAEQAPLFVIRTIDLGKGMGLYKERLMSGAVTVASGSVELPSLLALRRGARRKLRALALSSPLAGAAKRLLRRTRGGAGEGKE